MTSALWPALRGRLIVSCQAPDGSPLADVSFIVQLARAAADGGASAIRAQGLANVTAIRDAVDLPIVGLIKRKTASPIYITPTVDEAVALASAGADVVAVDATDRLREDGTTSAAFLAQAKAALGDTQLMADIDDLRSAMIAADAGADVIATTMSGYTGGPVPDEPDFALIEAIAGRTSLPIVAEGRFSTPAQVRRALDAGAWAVCVGTAITDPWTMTKKFVRGMA